jgi:hypothetical protein
MACPANNLGSHEKSQKFFATDNDGVGDGSLIKEPPAAPAAAYVRHSNVGILSASDMMALKPLRTISFKSAPLSETLWLNTSKPVHGSLFYSVSFHPDANGAAAYEMMYLHIEVWSGGVFVGGEKLQTISSVAWPRFMEHKFCFRPEADVLAAGQPVEIRVVQYTAQKDLAIGTLGPAQTQIEFRHFGFNPLNSTAYREGNSIVFAPPPEAAGENTDAIEDPENALTILLMAPLLAGVAALRGGGRTRVGLVALGLLAVIVSGCVGESGRSDGTGPQPSPTDHDVLIRHDENLSAMNLAKIQGFVFDPEKARAPVAGARVILLGTALENTTDAKGRFVLGFVQPGNYGVRVEAKGFPALEIKIKVKAGEVADMSIPMERKKDTTSDLRPHDHDLWGESNSLPWQADVRFKPITNAYVFNVNLGGLVTKEPLPAGYWACFGSTNVGYQCSVEIPIDIERPVAPGATRMEVTLDWVNTGNMDPKMMALRIETPSNKSFAQRFMPRGPGQPFNIAFLPNEADPGHQKFTNWRLFMEHTSGPYTLRPLELSTTEFKMTATLYKGVVPLEPEHPDRWGNQTELKILDGARTDSSASSYFGASVTSYPDAYARWELFRKGTWVPEGASRIEGRVTISNSIVPSDLLTTWTLAYRDAGMPSARVKFEQLPRVEVTSRTSTGFEFVVNLLPQESQAIPDQFYQTASYWAFYLDDGKPPLAATSATGFQINSVPGQVTMTATVHKAA